MKLIVFSDSHGMSRNMTKATLMHLDTADCIIHLGDGATEFSLLREQYSGKTAFVSVAGNNDGMFIKGSPLLTETVLELEGFRILITHGHRYNVKYGLGQLTEYAYKKEADIVLFGHTHTREDMYIPPDGTHVRPLRLFNPGSISLPSDGSPSFGIIGLRRGQILTSCAVLN